MNRLSWFLATFAAMAEPAAAQTANVVNQFAVKHNPNGAWSYLAGGQLLDKVIPNCEGYAKFLCRWNGGSLPNSALIAANKTGVPVTYYTIVLPPRYAVLDSEDLANVTAQWTAPTAATVAVKGNFLGVDTSEASHSVAVLHNGVALGTYTIAHYKQKQKFNFTVTVAPGDTIGFASYPNGASYLSTGLQATIN